MKLKGLEYFQGLSTYKYMKKTAQAFSVSQPTISYAIKRLEEEFGLPLIIRSRSHQEISFTPAGQILLTHLDKALLELERASEHLKVLGASRLKFGLSPTIKCAYLSDFTNSVVASYINSPTTTIEDGSLALRYKLKKQDIHCAVFASAQKLSSDDYMIHQLARLPYIIAVSKEHPLAQKKAVSMEDLKHEELVIFNEHFVQHNVLNSIPDLNSNQLNIISEISDLHSLFHHIIEDKKVGFVAKLPIPSERVVYVPISDIERARFFIYFAYPKNLDQLEDMEPLLAGIKARFT